MEQRFTGGILLACNYPRSYDTARGSPPLVVYTYTRAGFSFFRCIVALIRFDTRFVEPPNRALSRLEADFLNAEAAPSTHARAAHVAHMLDIRLCRARERTDSLRPTPSIIERQSPLEPHCAVSFFPSRLILTVRLIVGGTNTHTHTHIQWSTPAGGKSIFTRPEIDRPRNDSP